MLFNKSKYSITADQIVVYPRHGVLTIFIILYVVLLLLPIGLLFSTATDIAGMLQFVSMFGLITGVLVLFPGFFIANSSIVFDKPSGTIFKKNLFGRSRLLHFDEVAEITEKTGGVQVGYFIAPKGDRYGKGTFLHPANTKSSPGFKHHVLPVIEAWLYSDRVAAPAHKIPAAAITGQLEYYTKKEDRYYAKTNSMKRYGFGFVFFFIIEAGMLYTYFTGTLDDTKFVFIGIIPTILSFAMLTKQVYFDRNAKAFTVKFLGITFEKNPLSKFMNFSVTRNTYNGMYNGTDVRLIFQKENGKHKQSFELRDFGKTRGIEKFIEETEYIIHDIQQS